MAGFIIGCLGTQYKPASDAMSGDGSRASRLWVRKLGAQLQSGWWKSCMILFNDPRV